MKQFYLVHTEPEFLSQAVREMKAGAAARQFSHELCENWKAENVKPQDLTLAGPDPKDSLNERKM